MAFLNNTAATTMCSGHKFLVFCIMNLFVVATPFKLRDLKKNRLTEALLRSSVVFVAKLKNCRVPINIVLLSKRNGGHGHKICQIRGFNVETSSQEMIVEGHIWSFWCSTDLGFDLILCKLGWEKVIRCFQVTVSLVSC